LADFDGDGVNNMLEWAFNLDANWRDAATVFPRTGKRGLPHISVSGTGASQRLRVEFVRLRAELNPNLEYVVEFSSSMETDSWLPAGRVLSVARIDDHWERVVVEDSQEGLATRYARVKVMENQ
jgi:hypothetical protein